MEGAPLMELVLYVIAIVLAAVAAFGVTTKVNLLALAVAFLAGAELVVHATGVT